MTLAYLGLILTACMQIGGWPMYITRNASGQRRYPKGTSRKWHHRHFFYVQVNDDDLDFTPDAPMFSPQHYGQVIMSVVGVAIWLAVIATSIYFKGFTTVWKVYLVPYLWLVPISSPESELELI